MKKPEPLDFPLITKADFLAKATAYPDRPAHVEAIETHMSWVFLTDCYAYKLKKPVAFDFINYRTIEARQHYCRAEVMLNRRLAPSVYLGTVPLTLTQDGELGLHGDGVVVDWLVQMRRLPLERRLDACISAGRVDRHLLARVLISLLDAYHDGSLRGLSASDYRRRLKGAIGRNESAMAILDQRHVIDRQYEFLNHRQEIIADRAGSVIDAHGDLRPEHIYLLDPPVVVDRLEFDSELRVLDPLDELAFLAIECERLSAEWIGDFAFACYCRQTGDAHPEALIAFYKSLRACMRARLALGHLIKPLQERHSPWFNMAEHYAAMALDQSAEMT